MKTPGIKGEFVGHPTPCGSNVACAVGRCESVEERRRADARRAVRLRDDR